MLRHISQVSPGTYRLIARKFGAAYFFEIKVNEMVAGTILFVSDHGPQSSSILAALEATGYDVASPDRSTQAIAMLFVMNSVNAVVIDQPWTNQSSFDLTRSLRALCPEVPIIALCDGRIDPLPPEVDSCLNMRQPPEKVTSDLKCVLAERPLRCDRLIPAVAQPCSAVHDGLTNHCG